MFTIGLFPSLPLPNPHSFLLVVKNETEQNKIPILLVIDQTISGEIKVSSSPVTACCVQSAR